MDLKELKKIIEKEVLAVMNQTITEPEKEQPQQQQAQVQQQPQQPIQTHAGLTPEELEELWFVKDEDVKPKNKFQ